MSTRSRALALGALLLTAGAFGAFAAVVTPQIGGGIDFSTDGGIGGNGGSGGGGVTPCSGTGLDFTDACNSQYIGIL